MYTFKLDTGSGKKQDAILAALVFTLRGGHSSTLTLQHLKCERTALLIGLYELINTLYKTIVVNRKLLNCQTSNCYAAPFRSKQKNREQRNRKKPEHKVG